MSNRHQLLKPFIIFLTVFFVFGYIIYPLWQLLLVGRSQPDIIATLLQQNILRACFNSFLLSVVSVIGSAFIGTYFAYSFHYKKIWLKPFFSVLILLPIAIPPIVGVMSYLFLLGENGLLMKLFNSKNNLLSGWTAILIIHLYSFYPLFYLFVGNALRNIDSSVVEASLCLGATKNKTFYSIILPQLKPSILGASLLTFMASMASFSAPFIFGGTLRFLTTEIYYSKINGDTSGSALLSLLLAAISIVALYFFKLYSKKIPVAGKTKGTAKKNPIVAYKKYSYPTIILSIIFGCVIILPILSLLVISLIPNNSMMMASRSYNFSLNNYYSFFSNNEFIQPLINSFQISLVALIFTVSVGLSVAHLINGKQNIFKSILEITSSIPYGIPGTVIALCLILSFNQTSIFSLNNILVGTFWVLPVAYAIRNLPVITQAIKAGLHSIDTTVEEASYSLGAGKLKTWRSITLPLIYPSIIEGSLLVFINSFGEFVATILLYTYRTKTIPIEIYAHMRIFNNGMAATFGIVLFIIIISIIYITRNLVLPLLTRQKHE